MEKDVFVTRGGRCVGLVAVVDNPIVMKTWRFGSQPLVRFLGDNIDALMKMAFTEKLGKTALSSFRILAAGDSRIVIPLLVDAKFGEFAMKVLRKNRKKRDIIISRIAEVTMGILNSGVHDVLGFCAYISRLLRHCTIPSVFELFSQIAVLKHNEHVRRWLVDVGFGAFVFRGLSKARAKGDDDNAVALLKLIRVSAESESLLESIRAACVIDLMSSDMSANWEVENARWNAIRIVYGESGHAEVSRLAVCAHGVLERPTSRLHEYHATCLAFLTEMMEARTDLFDECLVESVLGLMLQFPSCSFFHVEVRRFVKLATRVDVVRKRVIKKFGHVLVVEAEIREHGAIAMMACAIIDDWYKQARGNQKLQMELAEVNDFDRFVAECLVPRMRVLDREYGGVSTGSLWKTITSVSEMLH